MVVIVILVRAGTRFATFGSCVVCTVKDDSQKSLFFLGPRNAASLFDLKSVRNAKIVVFRGLSKEPRTLDKFSLRACGFRVAICVV